MIVNARIEFATAAPRPTATSASCRTKPASRPAMDQYPRLIPCVAPVAIDWTAPAPGDTAITIAAPKNASHICQVMT